MHVDRLETHIYSVIMQTDQIGVDVPWALEIIDFTGQRKEIFLEKGEMLLYESAP
eukprot:UN10072